MEDVTTEDLGDGTSTIRPKEDKREEKTQLQNIFPSQKAPEEPQKAKKVEEPVSEGAQVITDDADEEEEETNDQKSKSVPAKNEAEEPKKEHAQQKEEPKKKQSDGSEEPEGDLNEEVIFFFFFFFLSQVRSEVLSLLIPPATPRDGKQVQPELRKAWAHDERLW